MAIAIIQLHHLQITIPTSAEDACREFYGEILGLEEIPKPSILQKRGGMWYRLAGLELHVSPEEAGQNNERSKRHACLLVTNLGATELEMRRRGIEIIADKQPLEGWTRFYVRDPGGNRIEFAQMKVEPGKDVR
jgi:catechol 2,3-dioxygenase-like lactoylglutathione lyase family enzyme